MSLCKMAEWWPFLWLLHAYWLDLLHLSSFFKIRLPNILHNVIIRLRSLPNLREKVEFLKLKSLRSSFRNKNKWFRRSSFKNETYTPLMNNFLVFLCIVFRCASIRTSVFLFPYEFQFRAKRHFPEAKYSTNVSFVAAHSISRHCQMDSFEFDKLRRTVEYALKHFEMWEKEREKKDELLYVQSHFDDDDDVSSPCFLFAASCCCSLVFPFCTLEWRKRVRDQEMEQLLYVLYGVLCIALW